MSVFDRLMSNDVTIHRQDGTTQDFKCNIQDGGITIQDTTIKVTEGDKIHHKNPAGVNEIYKVDEVIYNTPQALSKDIHHISIKYTKVGSKKDIESSRSTYHLVNSNLSIGSPNASQGNSIAINIDNVEINDPEVVDKLNELQQELSKTDKDKSKIHNILNFVMDKAPDVIIGILTNILIP